MSIPTSGPAMFEAMAVQERIDRQMCKPGYTYDHQQKQCIPFAGGAPDTVKPRPDKPDTPATPGTPGETAQGAVMKEAAKRNNSR